ncbi:hypothetical protein [Paenibacillus sp. H1-7]|nr:hypothetical protein [Paenibacillus sp. H1-7]
MDFDRIYDEHAGAVYSYLKFKLKDGLLKISPLIRTKLKPKEPSR